ncbi:TPA: GTP cyclohydrolase II [Candidatus Thalassarchaeaceae archaeon]|nr:GTP cyclohydrolase II [Euryarchaeota archaeon]MDG1547267.1 GTP cyclohydrolase II [Candidatus Thalassarchaeaceae archaeon]MDG1553682.1 GTP cyclohydrolase II [Candidatus Thalassarchaeaceae archaeon]DAC65767.1 MAG TPA: GTP cyclohydrolase II [Candidatus Poseidoniales archaeon]HII42669.1 GTP cyclohydrolase II [Candidatus Thalassarchaeaceae archaeon]
MESGNKIEIQEKIDVPADARLPTKYGEFRIRIFHESSTGLDHVALTLGDMSGPDPVLVRVHSECITGDSFASTRCDCGSQLEYTLEEIQRKGWGCLVYLRQEGRGIGLHAKIQAYNLQDKGADTLDANLMLGLPGDARDYSIASIIFDNLGIKHVSLLTNNPDKVEKLENLGIKVFERVPLIVGVGSENIHYLKTKGIKMGHHISSSDLEDNTNDEV